MSGTPRLVIPDELNIDVRSGLPEDWTFLLEKHPKDTWQGNSRLGEHATFWLAIHRNFRMMAAHLTSVSNDYREGRVDGETFRRALAPRLQQFLGTLDHHHRIEDHHFFPHFIAAEPRFEAGIALLEADHEVIDEQVHTMVERANALLRAQGQEAVKRSGADFADGSDRIVALLHRHLDDEEDIVVPLMLDRGEVELLKNSAFA
ncbi:hemerythrin domain-containing protein [Rhizobiaceae bacterium]|nr:hemerythrin domain-containing protein [Rhizobiaceae bacterium]